MNRRLILLILSIAVAHFSLSVLLFLLFGIGLENRSIGSDLFWFFQQPVIGLVFLGVIPDFKLLIFPLNSFVWGCVISGLIRFFSK